MYIISEGKGTSFKRKLTFGADNLKQKTNPLENISRHISPRKSLGKI